MRAETKWIAVDNTEFNSQDECKAYEVQLNLLSDIVNTIPQNVTITNEMIRDYIFSNIGKINQIIAGN